MAKERRSGTEDRRRNARGGRRMTDKPLDCPRCGCLQSIVLPSSGQTRAQQLSGGYWRRRRCGNCGTLFSTSERVEEVEG